MTGGDDLRLAVFRFTFIGGLAGQDVACNLIAHELVVGHVLIERMNHPISVAIHFSGGIVRVAARRIGIADHVEPVPPPTLAVLRAGEQAIHYFLKRGRRIVLEKRVDIFGRGRQSDQIECRAADQRSFGNQSERNQFLFVQLRLDEAVDSGAVPLRVVAGGRRLVVPDWLERPEPAGLREVVRRRDWRSFTVARIFRTGTDPLFEVGDDFV